MSDQTVFGSHDWRIVFAAHECTCDHPTGEHDDGFGCTAPECPCLAGFQIERDQ